MTTNFDPRAVHHQHRTPHFIREPHLVPPQHFPQPPSAGRPAFHPQGFPGQQFPGPVPPPAAPLPRKRPIAGKIIAGLVAAGLVLGGAGTWVALSGSASAAVQATSFAGADPTTAPFGTAAPEVATVAATGPQSGDTDGLFAATTPPSCDNAAFLRQLQADPAKLAAWGGVFGLGATDVPAFVDSLSPVVLRAATSVTDHPFREGAFVEEAAVLAPGTAVLVNSYGEPTVKCFNGNPLSAGPQADAAVTIAPTTQQIVSYRFTSIDNSRVVVIPAKPDTKPVPGPNKPPVTVPTPDPVLVKKAEEQKKLADQARKDATDSRAKADDSAINAKVFRSESDRLAGLEQSATARAVTANGAAAKAQQELNNAFLSFPPNPRKVAQAQAALAAAKAEQINAAGALVTARNDATKADQEADTAESQLKNAEAKARNDENVAKAAEENAKKAQDAADASAKETAPKPATDPKTLTAGDPAAPAVDEQVPAVPAEAGTQVAGTGAAPEAPTPAATCPAGTTATATPVTDPATQCAAATTGTSTGTTGTDTAPKAKDADSSGTSSESTGSSTGSSDSGSTPESGSSSSSEATEN